MAIGVGLDVHRAQITYDALNTATEEVATGRIAPGDPATLRIFLRRWAGEDVEAAVEATTDRRPELRMRPVGGGQLVGHALAPGDARPGPSVRRCRERERHEDEDEGPAPGAPPGATRARGGAPGHSIEERRAAISASPGFSP
jgi:hypothetical protein